MKAGKKEPKDPLKQSYSLLKPLGLRPKQAKFIIVYCNNGFNGRKAYIEAGYRPTTEGGIDSCASELLRNPKVAEALRVYLDSVLAPQRTELEKRLFDTYFNQAFYDPSLFYNPDGTIAFSDWAQIPQQFRCCIESMNVKCYGKDADREVLELKLIDRKWAQAQLDKYIGMSKETKVVEFSEIPAEQAAKLAAMFPGGKR